MVRTLGNEVVAIRQFTQYDAVQLRTGIGAFVAHEGDAELAGVRCSHVRRTRGERDFVHTHLVQAHLIALEIVDITFF